MNVQKFMPGLKITALLLLFGIVGSAASGCFFRSKAQEKDKESEQDQEVPVEVVRLGRGQIRATVRTSANLEAEQEVKVFSRAANLVRELLVEEGETVTKDQVLVRLENDLQRIQLSKAQAQLAKANQEFARQEALFMQALVSEQAFADTKFELQQLGLALEEAQQQWDYTEIRAPISGVISRRLVNLGDHVTVNQHLFDVLDFESIVARGYIPEKHLPQVSLGQTASVSCAALGSEPIAAFVKRVAPVVDPKSGTFKVTVGFPEHDRLRPGLWVDVEIVLAVQNGVVLIPKRCQMYDGDQIYVFRVLEDKRVERVLVEPALADQDFILPVSGFNEGDSIVIAGQTGLKDGARVKFQDQAGTVQTPAPNSPPAHP